MDVQRDDVPRYPPFAKGLPATSIDAVLESQAGLIRRIQQSLDFDGTGFDALVLPVIRRYAEYVHLLPASEAHHHRGAGGLFRHGLEVGFWAAQASGGVIFVTEGSPRERHENEPRWRLASFIAGLLHDVGKPLSDVVITNASGDKQWNPYSTSLYDWARSNHVEDYFLRWRDRRHKRHEQFSLLAVDRLLPVATRDYLAAPGPAVLEAILEAIAGTSVNQPVTKLMLFADQTSVAQDLKHARMTEDEAATGVPVERYVLDAIRALVNNGRWKVNQTGAKVWHLGSGVFIAWKKLDDLYQQIDRSKTPGIPRDPDTLADILIERGICAPNPIDRDVTQEKSTAAEGGYYRYWPVLPDLLRERGVASPILMLKFQSPGYVFTGEFPPTVQAAVGEVRDTPAVEAPSVGERADPLADEPGDFLDESQDAPEAQPEIPQPPEVAPRPPRPATVVPPPPAKVSHEKLLSRPGTPSPGEVPLPPGILGEAISTASARPAEAEAGEGGRSDDIADIDSSAETQDAAMFTLTQLCGEHDGILDLLVRAVQETSARPATPILSASPDGKTVLIRYPDAAAQLGEAKQVLAGLSEADLIDPDPIIAARKVQTVQGCTAIVFKRKVSAALLALAEEGGGFPVIAAADSSRQTRRERESRPPQSARTWPQPESPKAAQPLPSKSPVQIPDQPVRPEPPLKSAPVEAHAIKPGSAGVSAVDQAVQKLKAMMLSGHGEWLAGEVVEEDGCLVTDGAALKRLVQTCPGETEIGLRTRFNRLIQDPPIVRIHGGKLYLRIQEARP